MRTPRLLLQAIGALLAVEGAVGVVLPEQFRALVVGLQTPPAWPASIIARAALGGVLLAAPATIACRACVRVVGAVTLAGAVVGLFVTDVPSWPGGPLWRLPAAVLAAAGLLVVRSARAIRSAS